jgi:hypothetical protein
MTQLQTAQPRSAVPALLALGAGEPVQYLIFTLAGEAVAVGVLLPASKERWAA